MIKSVFACNLMILFMPSLFSSRSFILTEIKELEVTIGKILVIEDNALNRKLVRDLLSIGKYHVLEAGDAEGGIKLAQEQTPDLVLMDIQLPGMNGLEATKVLKRDPILNHIPIVALTGCAMRGDKEMALEVGCAGYITKPIDTRAFLKKISHFLNHHPKRSK